MKICSRCGRNLGEEDFQLRKNSKDGLMGFCRDCSKKKARIYYQTHKDKWLKNNGYPDGYRVLCMNCNFSIGSYGYCPHKTT